MWSAIAGSQPGRVYYRDWVAVLMYHTFDRPADSPITVRGAQFEDHLRALQAAGFNFISASQFRAWKTDGAPIPPNAVLLTIDDGWPEVATIAAPILQRHRVPAVAFVIYSRIDRSNNHMTSDQLRSLPSYGVDVESHSWHLHQTIGGKAAARALPLDQLLDDADRARAAHRRLFGRSPDMMAYPFGAYGRAFLQSLRDKGIGYGFTTRPGLASRGTPDLEIPRINGGERGLSGKELVQRIVYYVRHAGYHVGGGYYRTKAEAAKAAAYFTTVTGYRMYVAPHPSREDGYWVQTGRTVGYARAEAFARQWEPWGLRYIMPAD